jgi:hypothetical protein
MKGPTAAIIQRINPAFWLKRPLSCTILLAAAAGLGYCVELIFFQHQKYAPCFNWVDATTIGLIALLLMRAVVCLRRKSDLTAAALAIVLALSFIYTFEAVYKALFWSWIQKPAELHDLLLQSATALTILTGFAYGDFFLTKKSIAFLGLWVLAMGIWYHMGYPQLFDPRQTPLATIYAVNRAAKFALFGAFLFFCKGPPACPSATKKAH